MCSTWIPTHKISTTCSRYLQGKCLLPSWGINTCPGSRLKFVASADLHWVADIMHPVFQIAAAFVAGILHYARNECLGAENKSFIVLNRSLHKLCKSALGRESRTMLLQDHWTARWRHIHLEIMLLNKTKWARSKTRIIKWPHTCS